MKVSFLFLDECYSDATKISSLTGLLVPLEDYPRLRTQFYDRILRALFPDQEIVLPGLNLPELHASALLKDYQDADDEKRFVLFGQIVDLVIANQLEVYRVGYYKTKRIVDVFEPFSDSNLQGLCFHRLIFRLQERLANEIIIPVMDGFESSTVEKFSSFVKSLDVIRATNLWKESDLSIKHSENILGEVFYADSKFAIFTQVVDMVSYLRHVRDLSLKGKELAPFKCRLLAISERLSSGMTVEEVVRLQMQGPTRG